MKKTDIALIIIIAMVSACVAFFAAQMVFGDINRTAKVKTIEKISSSLSDIDAKIFNENAINPAVPVEINGSDKKSE